MSEALIDAKYSLVNINSYSRSQMIHVPSVLDVTHWKYRNKNKKKLTFVKFCKFFFFEDNSTSKKVNFENNFCWSMQRLPFLQSWTKNEDFCTIYICPSQNFKKAPYWENTFFRPFFDLMIKENTSLRAKIRVQIFLVCMSYSLTKNL